MDDILNKKPGRKLAERIAKDAGVKLHECYQCGKCSAGCPMAHAMDIMPRQLVHYMKLGKMDEVLESKTIWLCATCHTCVDRCPHSINIPGLMEQSRMEAKKQGSIAVKEVDKFTDIFLGNVKTFGKSQEVILEGIYNLTTGNFTQDMNNTPHMLKHKIIRPEVNVVNDRAKVKEIMAKSLKRGEDR